MNVAMRSTIVVLVWVTMVSFVARAAHGHVPSWPPIAPLERSFYFANADKASVDLTILTTDHKPAYLLICRALDAAPADSVLGFNFSGDFECIVRSAHSIDRYSTLLTENPNQVRDWESRGRVFAQELEGTCADYPEYGRVRHFRLRGMELTLAFSEVVLGTRPGVSVGASPRLWLRSFRLDVRVKPDPSALGSIAEPAPFLPPGEAYTLPSDCSVVRPRDER